MRLGIDNGNYYTKSSTGFKYMSGLKEDSTAVAALNRITYDGRHYTVGECRNAIEIDKTSNSNMLIQSLPAIAEGIKRNMGNAVGMMPTSKSIELELGVGTPLKMYGKEAPKYRKYFIDQDLEYDWNGEKFHVLIKRVEVYPQGYAAYMANYNMFADYSELNVIDIGGGTDDAFMIRNGLPVTETFRTLNDGVITLVNKCSDILEMEGIYISESQICNAIMDKDVFHVRKD